MVHGSVKRNVEAQKILPSRLACMYMESGEHHVSDGHKKAQVAREFSISRETLYQYLRTG